MKRGLRRTALRLLLPTMALLAACSGGDEGSGPTGPRPAELRVANASLEILQFDSARIVATVIDDAGSTVPGATITFVSGDPSIATVSATGMVTAVGPRGSATVTATSGALSQTVQVRVAGRGHPEGVLVLSVGVPGSPGAIAVSNGGRAVIAADGNRLGTLVPPAFPSPVPESPGGFGVAIDTAGTRAFACCVGTQELAVIDVATARVAASIGGLPLAIVLDVVAAPDGRRAWVGALDGRVYAYDVASGRLVGTVDPQTSMRRLRLDATGSTLYSSNSEGRVTVIDAATSAILRTVSTTSSGPIALSPDGRTLYAASEHTGRVGIYLLESGASVAAFTPPDCLPNDVVVSPDGAQLWAACQQGTVVGIDIASRTVVSRLTVGGTPRRMAFDAGGVLGVANTAGWIDVIR